HDVQLEVDLHSGRHSATIWTNYLTYEYVKDGSDCGGHGIAGMRERAQAAHGRLHAAPLPGGGFEVAVRVPTGMSTPPATADAGDAV
ncbi:MAG: hypothetical protein ABWY21_02380, partial [Rhodococcus sp. (in: high G+C Gram-positive bacteria)]